jgi:Terminase large subunit, T4likevirus-type, N-terminal
MNDATLLNLALDPIGILVSQNLAPDPWQRQLLLSKAPAILLNCSRGAGKSRTTSALALHTALFRCESLILLTSRSQRQANELFRYVKQGYRAVGCPLQTVKETETQLELENGSRIVCLPGTEETIRSFQGVNLLVLDEAARIPDELYASVSPMTGVSKGRVICLSTPFGQRGWWWREWFNEKAHWQRFRIPWNHCPRLTSEFIEEERLKFGDAWIEQEYECSFTAMEGLVYPNFVEQTKWPADECSPHAPREDNRHAERDEYTPRGKRVGGIDFGFRNPFAAVWGVVHDDVLSLDGEIYVRQTPLPALLKDLPPDVLWAADPAGAAEIAQLRQAGFKVLKGRNDIRAGIAAVTARLQTGRLRVHAQRCPNLLNEARLYRYPEQLSVASCQLSDRKRMTTDSYSENPVDQDNHALAALRYLVSRLDAHYLAKYRRDEDHGEMETTTRPASMDFNDPALWTTTGF